MPDAKIVTTKYFLGVDLGEVQLNASNSNFYVSIRTDPQSYLKKLIDQGFIDKSYHILPGMELAFFKKLEKEIDSNSVSLDTSSIDNLKLMYGKLKKQYITLEDDETTEKSYKCW